MNKKDLSRPNVFQSKKHGVMYTRSGSAILIIIIPVRPVHYELPPCPATLALTFSRWLEKRRCVSNFCAVMSGPGVYSLLVQSRHRMRGSHAYLTPSGNGCVWRGSSVCGSRYEYFMMASNLSPCGYCFSRSLRADTSHSGGGGCSQKALAAVSFNAGPLRAWCAPDLPQEAVIAPVLAAEREGGQSGQRATIPAWRLRVLVSVSRRWRCSAR